jgi:hypothetical protein
MLAGAATLLAACAADPGYDPSQFAYGYPVYAAPPYDDLAFGAFEERFWPATGTATGTTPAGTAAAAESWPKLL